MAGLLLMVALLAVVWRKRGSRGEAGAELQEQEEQGNLGQELQEMIGEGESWQSRAENLQGLKGRIEPEGEKEGERIMDCLQLGTKNCS